MHAARGRRLIESLLAWISGLPPQGIYLAIALLAALENIVPPVPADTAVALGAFLAARGAPVTAGGILAVTVVANVGSALAVFLAARRYGRPFFQKRLGRRLLSEKGEARVARAYGRHHLWGIFFSRFLPVYRAMVPPFAGIAGLRVRHAMPPIALATAIYYGLLVLAVHQLGANWEAVRGLLDRVGLVLGMATLAVTVAIVTVVVRRLRARRGDP